MSSLLLIDYLQRTNAHFQLLNIAPAETAAAAARQLPRSLARNLAKVVILRIDGELMMVVLPSHYRVSLDLVRTHLCATHVELAAERQFRNHFPRCELGAIPPIAHIYGLRGFLAPVFEQSSDIVFKAGSHSELVRMPYHEFRRLAHLDALAEGAVPPLRNAASLRARLLPLFTAQGIPVTAQGVPAALDSRRFAPVLARH